MYVQTDLKWKSLTDSTVCSTEQILQIVANSQDLVSYYITMLTNNLLTLSFVYIQHHICKMYCL
jgi:hypothetical protein